MDLTLLNYFYTVAREGSFMAAAEKLDYAQSNLSMRIKQLEEMAVAVGENSHEDLFSNPLRKEELVLVTDRSDQESDLKKLLARPLLVFPSGCAYRRVLERMLADYGIVAVHTMEFTSLGAILASASAGLGISVFPATAINSFTAGDSLRMISLPEEYKTADIYLIFRRQSVGNRTLRNFIEMTTAEE